MIAPGRGDQTADPMAGLGGLRSLLGEVNDLKRIRAAGRLGSLAERGFARSWGALIGGEALGAVARRELAHAIASARLGAIDGPTLADAGLDRPAIELVLRAAIAEVGAPLGRGGLDWIQPAVVELAGMDPTADLGGGLPEFVALLQAQPRAGATRPGHARLVLEPPENHAEHCYITAVYAALLSPYFGADAGTAFVAGLAHHFHNAYLPDSGFTGEELLGEQLGPIMARFTARAMAQLPEGLIETVRAARAILPDAATPEGRAFHAGDVFDRVLQMEQYSRVAAFETRMALEDLDLVHPGPLQAFHQEMLAAVGLGS